MPILSIIPRRAIEEEPIRLWSLPASHRMTFLPFLLNSRAMVAPPGPEPAITTSVWMVRTGCDMVSSPLLAGLEFGRSGLCQAIRHGREHPEETQFLEQAIPHEPDNIAEAVGKAVDQFRAHLFRA